MLVKGHTNEQLGGKYLDGWLGGWMNEWMARTDGQGAQIVGAQMGKEMADFRLPLAPPSYLLLLGPEVTDLLLILLPEPFHVLPGLLQEIPLTQQLPILPSQHVHVVLQLSLVTQEPTVEGAETPRAHLVLTNFSPTPVSRNH